MYNLKVRKNSCIRIFSNPPPPLPDPLKKKESVSYTSCVVSRRVWD